MRQKYVFETLRWIAVWPLAHVASAVGYSAGIALQRTHPEGWLTDMSQFLALVPAGVAFSAVGLIAPRWRVAIAVVLASLWIPQSLQRHIMGQADIPRIQYLHAAGESLGALLGCCFVAYWSWSATPSQPSSEA